MTLGEKIKYIRKKLGFTQDDLHQQTGINLTTIKKYETNRVQPLPPQVDRIASVLNMSYVALNGIDSVGFRLKTVGDLIGILMALITSGIINIEGDRDENGLLITETVSMFINPIFGSYIQINNSSTGAETISHNKCSIVIKNKNLLEELLTWERLHYLCVQSECIFDKTSSEYIALTSQKEELELDLQKDQTLL